MTAHAPARTGDALAIGLSSLCLIHCLALPVLAGMLPLLGIWAEAEWVHWAFVALAVPVSLWTLARSSLRRAPIPALLLGLALAGCGLLIAGATGYPDASQETPLTVLGGLTLAAAHAINWRRRRHCRQATLVTSEIHG